MKKILAAVMALLTILALTACTTLDQSGEPVDNTASMIMTVGMLVVMVAVFYFMIIRPQKKKEKADRQLRASLQPGDTIVTIGGFTGKVLSIKDDEVTFETGAAKTRLTIKKWAIQSREGAAVESDKETEESK